MTVVKKLKRLKSSRKTLIKQMDLLASMWVRMRDKKLYGGLCPLCRPCRNTNPGPIECAFHWITRGKHILRWSEINLTASCWPCNAVFSGKWGGGNQATFWKWYQTTYGMDQFNELESMSHKIANFGIGDLMALKADIDAKLAGQ